MKLECQRVVFTGKAEACLEDTSLGHDLGPDQILLQTRWSLISPGTELAIYTNQRDFGASPHPFPVYPGYAAMGVVQAVGAAVAGFTPGDRVFAISGHASHTVISPANSFCLRLPDDLRNDFAPFIRMMLISLASLCRADIQPGEWSGVVGLGLVGNLAAQMGRCAGYNVIGAGRSKILQRSPGDVGFAMCSQVSLRRLLRRWVRLPAAEAASWCWIPLGLPKD